MKAVSIPLSKAESKAIAEMALSEPFSNLMRVVAGQMDQATLDAIEERKLSTPDNNHGQAALQHEESAMQGQDFLTVAAHFRSLSAEKDIIFSVIEIKPSR